MRIQMDGDVVFLPINSLRCAASEVGSGRRRSLNLKPEAEPTRETVSSCASRRQFESSNSNYDNRYRDPNRDRDRNRRESKEFDPDSDFDFDCTDVPQIELLVGR
jgi:hypothetical protein